MKPSFFKNEQLAELPYEARLLFIGLWCMADREGRLEDRPKRIKAEVFPYDNVNVPKMLNVLTCTGFTLHYESDEKRYIQIINFKRHQWPHSHEARSVIPPCTVQEQNSNRSRPSESPIPYPLSPILNTAIQDIAGVFDSLWLSYPKRLGRKAALRHFRGSVKTEADVSAIRVALENYKNKIVGIEKQYVQHGSTWFNNWRDYVEAENGNHDSAGGIDLKALARSAREAKRAREEATAGVVSDGSADMPAVQSENRRSDGGTDQ